MLENSKNATDDIPLPNQAQLNRDLTRLPAKSAASSAAYKFDPGLGTTVVRPPGSGAGWWVGAPCVVWTGDRYYLSYRTRRPQPERGGNTQIAVSTDGEAFETVWAASKDDFGTSSIERSALVPVSSDLWRLYISYVDGSDGRWRIDVMEASEPAKFDPNTRHAVLTAGGIGAEGVKDPWIGRSGDDWLMFMSFAPTPQDHIDHASLHATKDVYNTGLTKSLTGVATSRDGLAWRWEGCVLQPQEDGWDRYATRLNSVLGTPEAWFGFYDGSGSVAENYEERCGAVRSNDLRHWERIGDGPVIGAARGPGSVRYLETVQTADWTRFYYEYTRDDGAHELRTCLADGPAECPSTGE